MSVLQLDTLTHLQPDGSHSFELVLTNLGAVALRRFSLGFAAAPKVQACTRHLTASLLRLDIRHHDYAAPDDLCLAPGDSWRVSEADIGCGFPLSDGVDWIVTVTRPVGPALALLASDLQVAGSARLNRGGGHQMGVSPQPQRVDIAAFAAFAPKHLLVQGGEPEQRAMAVHVNALSDRLFPQRPTPFVFAGIPGTPRLRLQRLARLASQAYRLDVSDGDMVLSFSAQEGLRHGLITLAQMLGAAWQEPARFAMPANGVVQDQPKTDHRDTYLALSHQIQGPDQVRRLLDAMAWQKRDRLHWQLSDGEDWRIDFGPSQPGRWQGGRSYDRDQLRDIVTHARSLGIEVIPEIDLARYHAASLGDDLSQPLDDAAQQIWGQTSRILSDLCAVFPGSVIHIGGSPSDAVRWLASARAIALQQAPPFPGPANPSALYLRRAHELLIAGYVRCIHDFLRQRGRIMGFWADASFGPAIPRQGSLSFLRGPVAADFACLTDHDDGPQGHLVASLIPRI